MSQNAEQVFRSKKMKVERLELSELLLFLSYNKGRCVVYISH